MWLMALTTAPDFQSICEKEREGEGSGGGAGRQGEAAGGSGWCCFSFFFGSLILCLILFSLFFAIVPSKLYRCPQQWVLSGSSPDCQEEKGRERKNSSIFHWQLDLGGRGLSSSFLMDLQGDHIPLRHPHSPLWCQQVPPSQSENFFFLGLGCSHSCFFPGEVERNWACRSCPTVRLRQSICLNKWWPFIKQWLGLAPPSNEKGRRRKPGSDGQLGCFIHATKSHWYYAMS